MVSLIATDVFHGLLPVLQGPLQLAAATPARITSVMPFRGRAGAVQTALGRMGLGLPEPGQSREGKAAAILWSGRGQAFLLDADPEPLAGIAALTDQSDAWAVMRLTGPGWDQVLSRLVALDLRPSGFPEGAVARSGLNHMNALFRRLADGVEIWVFRSMAATAVEELAGAMARVAARG